MKRILCFLLVLVSLVGLVPVTAQAATPTSGTFEGISWVEEGDTITFTGSGYLSNYSQYGDRTYWGTDAVRHIVVGDGFYTIAWSAITDCPKATVLSLPTSIISLGGILNMGQIDRVYYAGSQAQWDQIAKSDGWEDYITLTCAVADSSYWYQSGGKWHYSENGLDVTGWNVIGGQTYYMERDGGALTGWQYIREVTYGPSDSALYEEIVLSEGTYYFNEDGAMQTGWQQKDGAWYYLRKSDGAMVTRDTVVDGRLSRFDETGRWLGYGPDGFYTDETGKTYYTAGGATALGWQQLDGKWYYFGSSGAMETGWICLGSKTYYLNETGVMLTGWQQLSGTWYFFHSDGHMQIGWMLRGGYWYYFFEDGALAQGKVVIDGKYYAFDGENRMLTGWITVPNGDAPIYYYAGSDGSLKIGWFMLSGKWYYAYLDGHVAYNTYIDGYRLNNYGNIECYQDPDTLFDYYYGCLPEQIAEAEAQARAMAQDALANGGNTQKKQLTYLLRQFHRRCNSFYKTTGMVGAEGTPYGPLCLGYSYNSASVAAFCRILDYMGYSWTVQDGEGGLFFADSYIFLKMDGEWGWIRVEDRDIGYGNPQDEDNYEFTLLGEYHGQSGSWEAQGGKWYFRGADGGYLTGWQFIQDRWYYLDSSGVMQTGWLTSGGTRYYLQASGAMKTGWHAENGKWYYFGSSGALVTGKFRVREAYYYANSSGVMLTGWQYMGGNWYYFDHNGVMARGLQTINGQDYFFDSEGQMQIGWVWHFKRWFYAGSSGALEKGWTYLGGQCYYFYKDGHMAENTFIGNYYVTEDGVYSHAVAANPNHNYYTGITAQQAAQADAVAKAIAEEAMKNGGPTQLQQVRYASRLVEQYVDRCRYENDANRYYRSPYGVFVAGVFTCAGSTRAMGRVLDYMGLTWYHIGEDQWEHQWVCVMMDGEYGWVEPQLGEAGYGNYREFYIP